jgi:DNA-binding NarL/FixJ family response regulator
VLKLLVQGKPNKLICRDLTLSEGTVKVHVSAILKALRVARAPRRLRCWRGAASAPTPSPLAG